MIWKESLDTEDETELWQKLVELNFVPRRVSKVQQVCWIDTKKTSLQYKQSFILKQFTKIYILLLCVDEELSKKYQ